MSMFHAFKRLEQPQSTDLVVATGTLCATPGGILTRLKPPLERLPGYIPWRFAPGGLAALQLLASGDGRVKTTRSIETMLKLTEDDCRSNPIVRAVFEQDSGWQDDVERIIRWGVGLASQCPDPEAARDLARLATMRTEELDQYVSGWLPG